MKPIVSVVMPVFNGERYLVEAANSIFRQTHPDFEFIIVDDGSTDGTADLLADLRRQDDRVKVITQPHNLGVAAALNAGCQAARGIFVARMDADDVSLPDRFMEQTSFLNRRPDIALVGGAVQLIDQNGRLGRLKSYPTDSALVAWSLNF